MLVKAFSILGRTVSQGIHVEYLGGGLGEIDLHGQTKNVATRTSDPLEKLQSPVSRFEMKLSEKVFSLSALGASLDHGKCSGLLVKIDKPKAITPVRGKMDVDKNPGGSSGLFRFSFSKGGIVVFRMGKFVYIYVDGADHVAKAFSDRSFWAMYRQAMNGATPGVSLLEGLKSLKQGSSKGGGKKAKKKQGVLA